MSGPKPLYVLPTAPPAPKGGTAPTLLCGLCASLRSFAAQPDAALAHGVNETVQVLLALLPSSEERLSCEATAALAALSTASEEHRASIVNLGGVPKLLSLITRATPARALAANCLARLTQGPGHVQRESHIASQHPVAALIALLTEGASSDSAVWGVRLLRVLAESPEGGETACVQIGEAPHAMRSLIAILCADSDDSGEAATAIFALILRLSVPKGGPKEGLPPTKVWTARIGAALTQLAQPPNGPPPLPHGLKATIGPLVSGVANEHLRRASAAADPEWLEDGVTFGRWTGLSPDEIGAFRLKMKDSLKMAEKNQKLQERREWMGIQSGAAQKAAIKKQQEAVAEKKAAKKAAVPAHLPSYLAGESDPVEAPPQDSKRGGGAVRKKDKGKRGGKEEAPPPVEEQRSSSWQRGGGAWGFLRRLQTKATAADAFAPPSAEGQSAGGFSGMLMRVTGFLHQIGDTIDHALHPHAHHDGDGRRSRSSRRSRSGGGGRSSPELQVKM